MNEKLTNKEEENRVYSRKQKYIEGLNGIRGVSCFILAFFHHYLATVEVNHYYIDNMFIILRNWSSTYSFIAISGFLFAWLYADRKIDFKYFIKKRFIRIYPLFITTTIVTAIMEYSYYFVRGQMYGGVNCDLFHLFLNLFLIQNYIVTDIGNSFNGAANTICQLMICYIIFWISTNYTRNRFQRIIVWLGMCILGIWCYNMNYYQFFPLLSWIMGAIYFCFFGSCILCEIYKKIIATKRENIAIIMSISAIMLYLGIYFLGGNELIGDKRTYGITYVFFIVFPTIMLVTSGKILKRILSLRIFENLGKISFSIYLWNFPIYFGIYIVLSIFDIQECAESVWIWIATVVFSLSISACSYQIFEKRIAYYLEKRLL